MIKRSIRKFAGLKLLTETKRKAPAQAELRPTCAGASRVKLPL
jgi:hypothetical protein